VDLNFKKKKHFFCQNLQASIKNDTVCYINNNVAISCILYTHTHTLAHELYKYNLNLPKKKS
jgi:hypothetical protein